MALIARYLYNNGYNIEVVCEKKQNAISLSSSEYEYKLLPKVSRANTINLALRYFAHIIRYPADLYITRMMTPLLPFYRIASSLMRRPLIFSCASSYDVNRNFTGNGIPKVFRNVCKYSLNKCDKVVTQTEWQKNELINNHSIDSTVIPNAIDLDYWKPDCTHKTRTVVWLGNIRPVKRFDRLIHIAELCPDIDFIAIGSVYNSSKEQITDLPYNLKWVGKKSRSEVRQILQHSQILLSTSESEGFPNTLLEARALGLYSIFFNLDSLSTGFFDRDGYLGSTVETCQGAVKEINKYMQSSERWKKQSKKSMQEWVRNYSVDTVGRKWLELIESVLSELDTNVV